MLILLPPSETKRDGGEAGTRLAVDRLAFPELTAVRSAVLDVLIATCQDDERARSVLKLGPKLVHEVGRNRALREAPTLPSIDRYDGVLYDALDAVSLPADARSFADRALVIASALFGLTRALDPIPAYRLSADSRLPGLSLARTWAPTMGAVLERETGLVLDLRSEAYAALGPLPRRENAVFLRVVNDDGGRKRALNHFNKAGKGRLTRALLLAGIDHPDVDSLLAWAAAQGIRLEPGAPGELDLVV